MSPKCMHMLTMMKVVARAMYTKYANTDINEDIPFPNTGEMLIVHFN